ncbi:MAG: hypothetical protein CV090_14340, partial [Nitrospira sp. WS238]|nr:hypothetical protein [Nitrospira sp. WS238]
MKIRTIRGRIVWAIVLVGCIPLVIGLLLAYVSGMRSLRDVIGGNLQAVAVQAADRVTMLVQNEVQAVRLLGSTPLRVRQPVEAANRSYPMQQDQVRSVIDERTRMWQEGVEGSAHGMDAELSRFLLETKIRGGDKVIGLLIADQHGALVAASSDPDRVYFGDESWWKAITVGSGDQVYVSGLIPAQEGSFRTQEETIDIAVPILDERQRVVIGAVKASYRFDTL